MHLGDGSPDANRGVHPKAHLWFGVFVAAKSAGSKSPVWQKLPDVSPGFDTHRWVLASLLARACFRFKVHSRTVRKKQRLILVSTARACTASERWHDPYSALTLLQVSPLLWPIGLLAFYGS